MKRENRVTLLATLGLACMWPTYRTNYLDFRPLDSSFPEAGNASTVFLIFGAMAITGILVWLYAFFKKDHPEWRKYSGGHPILFRVGMAATISGYAVIAGSRIGEFTAFLPIGAELWTVGLVLLPYVWILVLNCVPEKRFSLALAVSCLLGSALSLLLAVLPAAIALWVAPAFMGASFAMYRMCLPYVKEKEERHASLREDRKTAIRQLARKMAIVVAFILITSLAEGYIAADATIGYQGDKPKAYGVINVAFALVLIGLICRVKDLKRFMDAAWVLAVGLCFMGIVLFPNIPLGRQVITETALIVCRDLADFLLFFTLVYAQRIKGFASFTLGSLFAATQIAMNAIAYCFMPLAADIWDLSLRGVAVVCILLMVIALSFRLYEMLSREKGNWPFAKDGGEKPSPPKGNARRIEAYARLKKCYQLTDREAEVLPLLANGYSRKAIAEQLCLSENTVNTHVRKIYEKTDCHKKDQLLQLIAEFEDLEDDQDESHRKRHPPMMQGT